MSVENLDEIIPVVDGLADNKAAVFAYTEQAYQDNDVNGVSQYDFSKEQNIPDRNSTDTNGQVLTKGFRSQGSSISRNFFNHFIGRFSYNLNKMVDMFKSFLSSYKVDYRKNGFMYDATLQYQVGDVCMDVWTDNTFAFFIRTGNGGSAGVRPMVADGENWTTSEHWACMGTYLPTAQTFVLRDKTGRMQAATPSAANDVANKNYVDTKSSSEAEAVQEALDTHIAATTGVHGATSSATANKIAIRDGSGRMQAATPSAANDVANKSYVDTKSSSEAEAVQKVLDTHIAATTGVHGATSSATANKIAIRDGSGRMQAATPSAANDVANKSYVDDKIAAGPGSLGESITYTTSGTKSITPGWYLVELWGGGGGGGSGGDGASCAGGGGGGGGSYTAVFMYIAASTIRVSIGTGGTRGAIKSPGDPGGTTSIEIGNKIKYVAPGGAGGSAANVTRAGSGGGGNTFGGAGGEKASIGFDGTNAYGYGGGGGAGVESNSGGASGGGGGGGGYGDGGEGGKGTLTPVGGYGTAGGYGAGGGGGGGCQNGIPGVGGAGGAGIVILTPFNN